MKILVAYFSASGKTAELAQTIARVTGGDLHEIKPAKPYTKADLAWFNPLSRSTKEMKFSSTPLPEIANSVENLSQYDVVFVGFPIWWYTAPKIINVFLSSGDFSGNVLVPFATSGGPGMEKVNAKVRELRTDAVWKNGAKMSPSESEESVRSWVKSLGL